MVNAVQIKKSLTVQKLKMRQPSIRLAIYWLARNQWYFSTFKVFYEDNWATFNGVKLKLYKKLLTRGNNSISTIVSQQQLLFFQLFLSNTYHLHYQWYNILIKFKVPTDDSRGTNIKEKDTLLQKQLLQSLYIATEILRRCTSMCQLTWYMEWKVSHYKG